MIQLLRSLLLVVLAASNAFAQQVLIDEIASFKPPFTIVEGALAETADGSVYGLYTGGINGGIYRVRPNGAGGYETTVVYEFGPGQPGPLGAYRVNGVLGDLIEAGPDGRIYFANADALMRFDPLAATVEVLHALPNGWPSSVIVASDGQTIYGANRNGLIYSFDTVSLVYREIASLGTDLSGIQQMSDGSLIATNDGIGTQRAVMNRVDPVSGAVTAQIVRSPAQLLPPSKGDDGEIYMQTSEFGDRVTSRVDVSCFCLQELYRIPWPNQYIPSTLAGARGGHLYINWDNNPHRINLNVTPPVLELIAVGGGFNYRILSNGTMLVTTFDADGRPIVNAVDLNSATPGAPAIAAPFTAAPVNDGLAGFPRSFTQGQDGALYGVAGRRSHVGPIFRVDPITRTRTIVGEIAFGAAQQSSSINIHPMVAGPDGMLYGSYVANHGYSAIFRFDPGTNAVTTLKEFPMDSLSTDGIQAGRLRFGSDGWLYGVTTSSLDETTNYSGAVFKIDPATGVFITLARPVLPFDFYPLGDMVETAPGTWHLTYMDNGAAFCGAVGRLDAATGEFAHVITFDQDAHGCWPEALLQSQNGEVLVRLGSGPGFNGAAIQRLDPGTSSLTMVHQFTTVFPTSTVSGADGNVYGTYADFASTPNTQGLFRLDPATGAFTALADTTHLGGPLTATTIARDGRIILVTESASKASAYAVAVLDPIAVAPASGPLGGSTTLSAALDAIGVPLVGVTISFTINGSPVGSAITNEQGVATLANVSLAGIAVGTHANAVGASFAGNEFFPATSGSGSLTVIDVPTPGLAVGAGHLRDGDRKTEFAFALLETLTGQNAGAFELEVKIKNKRDRFTAASIASMYLGDNSITFSGTGKWNGVSGHRFEVVATESDRRFRGALKVTITNASGNVVFAADDELQGGLIEAVRLRR